jgi:hypothetical protein
MLLNPSFEFSTDTNLPLLLPNDFLCADVIKKLITICKLDLYRKAAANTSLFITTECGITGRGLTVWLRGARGWSLFNYESYSISIPVLIEKKAPSDKALCLG